MAEFPNIAAVIKREQDALAAETQISQLLPFVAVNMLEDVARLPRNLRSSHPATANALSEAKGAAFAVDCPSLHSKVL